MIKTIIRDFLHENVVLESLKFFNIPKYWPPEGQHSNTESNWVFLV